MKIKSVSAIAMALLVVSVGTGYAGENCASCKKAPTCATKEVAAVVAKKQTNCPVMGGVVDKKLFVDAEGKRIYLCCEGCIAPVKKDPKKYIAKLEAEGITLEKTPVKKAPAEKPAEKAAE